MRADNSRRDYTLALAALLIAAVLIAYLPALEGGFIWDDDNYVTANPALRDFDGLRQIWFKPGAVPQYYPLTFTTLWAEYHLWELAPFGYHLVNVLLHALNALLFWQVLRLLNVPGAGLAAALFALHPIQVESVAWITERKNVLSGACYLGSALAYLTFSPPLEPPVRRWPWYALSLLLFVAALLSKTVACSLPAALLLILWWKRGRISGRDAAALAPFFVIGLATAAITVVLERDHVGAQGVEWAFTAVERCLIAGRILWFYLWTLLWPNNLTFTYPRWQIDASVWWQYLFPLAAVAAVIALFFLRRRWGAAPLVVALLYAGTLLPALGFFNVYPMRYSFVADHFAYLATLAPLALFAGAMTTWIRRIDIASNIAHGCAGALLILLAILTWQQGHVYKDSESLWRDTVAKNPTGWAGLLNLGGVLADGGNLDDAIMYMQRAVQLWPGAYESHNALGAMWDQQGRFDDAAVEFEEALRLEPRYYEAHTNLGIVLISQGKLEDAVRHLETSIKLKPEYGDAYYYLATALLTLGRTTEAENSFAATLMRMADHADAHNGMCAVQLGQGRLAAANHHCVEALRLNENSPDALENLARVLKAQGRMEDAAANEERARHLRLELAEVHRKSAALLVQQGKPKTAIAHLREALRFDPHDASADAELQKLRAADR